MNGESKEMHSEVGGHTTKQQENQMKAQLITRIEILHSAEMISATVADFCRKAIDYIINYIREVQLEADEERFAMLITHLAMGTQRLIDGQEENPVNEAVLAAVRQEPKFSEAEMLAAEIILLSGVTFSQTEADFLKIHLCNLLKN